MATGRPQVTFTNSYGQKLYIAYIVLDFNCQNICGEPWDVRGWINLDPGETETRSNPTLNRWYYYYAEADDGAMWYGNYLAEVTESVFEKCMCLGTVVSSSPSHNPFHKVGFKQLDLETYSGVNLTPK